MLPPEERFALADIICTDGGTDIYSKEYHDAVTALSEDFKEQHTALTAKIKDVKNIVEGTHCALEELTRDPTWDADVENEFERYYEPYAVARKIATALEKCVELKKHLDIAADYIAFGDAIISEELKI